MEVSYLTITVGAVFVYNFVLTRFLGICPFLGVSKKTSTALGMAGAVVFVMTIASALTSAIDIYLLRRGSFFGHTADLSFLQLPVFILVIAALVQIVEIILQKLSPALYRALGIFLPLITTNCAVLGAAQLSARSNYSVLQSTVFGAFSGVGFGVALLLFSSIRERLELSQIPRPFQGMSIALITAGILAMAFAGFAGLC